jgi:hypothetical protein
MTRSRLSGERSSYSHLIWIIFATFFFAAGIAALPGAGIAHADCAALMTGVALSTCVPPNPTDHPEVRIGGQGKCSGKSYYVDQSFSGLGRIVIENGATLAVPNTGPLTIEAEDILVKGTFQVGAKDCPIGMGNLNNKVTITFTGNGAGTLRTEPGCTNRDGKLAEFDKGIDLCQQGDLEMFGIKGVPAFGGRDWTTLLRPAGDPTVFNAANNVLSPVMEPDGQTIHITDAVDWKMGDWIAIATTSFTPYETELVQLASDPQQDNINGGYQITLNRPANVPMGKSVLNYYHFGSTAPSGSGQTNPACTDSTGLLPAFFCDPATLNFGVDERAEVGLLTRSIKLTSSTLAFWTPNNAYKAANSIQVRVATKVFRFDATSAGTSANQPPSWPIQMGDRVCDNGTGLACAGGVVWTNKGPYDAHWGGEIRVLHDFTAANIQGVELEKFGKDHLGSYPIHFHQDGDVMTVAPLVDSNSIHHSYNKCVTVHSTQNLSITNNVCVRAVGHLFYQEIGDETNTTFANNLGLGAMSNYFNISPASAIPQYWWAGDYLANSIGYDGFDIPDRDLQTNPSRGGCFVPDGSGGLRLDPTQNYPTPGMPCPANSFYTEPASGFWIVNPTANLTGNSIGGCQGTGMGYWYVPPEGGPPGPPFFGNIANQPVGNFNGNRAHGCYNGFFGEALNTKTGQLHPSVQGAVGAYPLIATFNGLTATRNRYLGAWTRPDWFVFRDARLATNRDDVSIVTSGGVDGGWPGVWSLFADSTVVGISQNNVDRFGPCPKAVPSLPGSGGEFGCVDKNPLANAVLENGYPGLPTFNFNGYFIYDGPPRIFNDRFVNFNRVITPYLTTSDNAYLSAFPWPKTYQPAYEGDAALGWFKSNQSAYPVTMGTERLHFTNVDFRHQIFTDEVNLGEFADGDKNTVILDRDGTLSNFAVVTNASLPNGNQPAPATFPVSLNNLPFNATSNSVDECHAIGVQNDLAEGRPTSQISPGHVATLELEALWPDKAFNNGGKNAPPLIERQQWIVFAKDNIDYPMLYPGVHWTMDLHGRNDNGVWEPKVQHGYGYTITVPKTVDPAKTNLDQAGLPKIVDVGLTDAQLPPDPMNPGGKLPFSVRLSLRYNGVNGPPKTLKVTRGFRSWGSPVGTLSPPFFNPELGKYWTRSECWNLDSQQPQFKKCPAEGLRLPLSESTCDTTSDPNQKIVLKVVKDPTDPMRTASLCAYLPFDLTKTNDLANVTPTSDMYYYNNGVVVFYAHQDDDNPEGPSPIGECLNPTQQTGCMASCPIYQRPAPNCSCETNNPCPDFANDETYYSCPTQGCTDYRITVLDDNYSPSAVADCNANPALCSSAFFMDAPANENQLTWATTPTLPSAPFTRIEMEKTVNGGFPHAVPSPAAPTGLCATNQP